MGRRKGTVMRPELGRSFPGVKAQQQQMIRRMTEATDQMEKEARYQIVETVGVSLGVLVGAGIGLYLANEAVGLAREASGNIDVFTNIVRDHPVYTRIAGTVLSGIVGKSVGQIPHSLMVYGSRLREYAYEWCKNRPKQEDASK